MNKPQATNDSTAPVIRVEGLKAAYGGNVTLRDIDFDVRRGEVFVILGPSGCGKSTLLKHMIGLYEPVEGRVWLGDRELTAAEGRERRAILSRLGVMYQNGALFGSMTLLENIRLPLEEFTDLPDEAMDRVARMKLRMVGLLEAAGRMPAQLSGGMRKRAAIARAMALDPPFLFLDEPSAGLDPVTSAGIDHLILQLSQALGATFVVVTHELPSIFAIADRVIMLDPERKTIVAEGSPEHLRDESDDPAVQRFFRRQAESVESETAKA